MKKTFLMLAVVASLSACATPVTSAAPSPVVMRAIDRADAAYARARAIAAMVLPYLSPVRAAQVRIAMAAVEHGLTAARAATTLFAQEAALRNAEAGMKAIGEIVPAS